MKSCFSALQTGNALFVTTGITLGFQHTQQTSNVPTMDFNDTNTSLGIQHRF